MVKKLKARTKSDDNKLVEAVRASAMEIWQAGLGAFAVAEKEGGKVYARLVKEGMDLQQRTRKLAEIKISVVTDAVSNIAENVSHQASESKEKLEKVFEESVSRTLTSLGVPTSRDLRTLNKRVAELSKSVAALSGKKPSAVKPATKAAPKTSKTNSRKAGVKAAAARTRMDGAAHQ